MKCKNGGRQPLRLPTPARNGASRTKAAEDQRKQAGRGRVQRDVYQMIADHRIAPQLVFQPKRTVQHRIILLGRAQLKPDLPKSMRRLQRRESDMSSIVPQLCAPKRGKVGQKSKPKNRHPEDQRVETQGVQ